MPHARNKLAAVIMPIIGMALFIILFVVGLVFFSYLLIIGTIIGLVLFTIAYIRAKFFAKKMRKHAVKQRRQGRTIEHDGQ